MWIYYSISVCFCLGLVSAKPEPTAEIIEEIVDERIGGINIGSGWVSRPSVGPCQTLPYYNCHNQGLYPIPLPSKPVFVPVPSPPERIIVPGPSIPVPIAVEKKVPYPVPISRPYPVPMPPVHVPYPVNRFIPIPGRDRLIPVPVPSDSKYYPVPVIVYVSPICRYRQPLVPFIIPGSRCLGICKVKYNYVYLETHPHCMQGGMWSNRDIYGTGLGGWSSADSMAQSNVIGGFGGWSGAESMAQSNNFVGGLGGYGSWAGADAMAQAQGGFGGWSSADAIAQSSSIGGMGGYGTWSGADAMSQASSMGLGGWSTAEAQAGVVGGLGGFGSWSNSDAQAQALGIGGFGGYGDSWSTGMLQNPYAYGGMGGVGGMGGMGVMGSMGGMGTVIRTRSGADSDNKKKRSADFYSALKPSETKI